MFSDKKGVDRFTLATCRLFQHCSMLPYLFLCIGYWSYSTHAPSTDFCTLYIIFHVTAFESNRLLTSEIRDGLDSDTITDTSVKLSLAKQLRNINLSFKHFVFVANSDLGFLCVGCRFWSDLCNRVSLSQIYCQKG